MNKFMFQMMLLEKLNERKLGVTPVAVGKWERGENRLTDKRKEQILKLVPRDIILEAERPEIPKKKVVVPYVPRKRGKIRINAWPYRRQ